LIAWSEGKLHGVTCTLFMAGDEDKIADFLATPPSVNPIGYGTIRTLSDDGRIAAGEAPIYRPDQEKPAEETFGHLKDKLRGEDERRSHGWESYELHEFKSRPTPRSIVDQLIRAMLNHLLFGCSQAYKTFTALELLGAVASGMAAFGEFKVHQPGDAIYFCDEDPDTVMRERWPAYAKARGMPEAFPRETGWPGRILILPRCPLVSSEQNVSNAIAHVNEKGFCPKLVITDTVGKAMIGLETNSAKDVGIYVSAQTNFRRAWGCATYSLHHTVKGVADVLRGSEAFMNDFDIVINAVAKASTSNVTWTWQKTKGKAPKPIRLVGTQHATGETDENGEQTTSLAFNYAGEAFGPGRPVSQAEIAAEHKTQRGFEAAAKAAERKERVLKELRRGPISIMTLAMSLERELKIKGESPADYTRRVDAMRKQLERDVLSAKNKLQGPLYAFADKTSDGEIVRPMSFRLPPDE
jgi:RecA-family ATPase